MKKLALAIVVISIQCAVLADLPVITNQPVSQTVSLGASNIILSVSVSNPPVSYQWYMTNCANTGPIPGATNSSYTITNMYAEDLADYMVMVTNVDGTNYSATATLSASCVYTPCDIKAWWQAETNKDFVGHFNATLGTHVSYASGKV